MYFFFTIFTFGCHLLEMCPEIDANKVYWKGTET